MRLRLLSTVLGLALTSVAAEADGPQPSTTSARRVAGVDLRHNDLECSSIILGRSPPGDMRPTALEADRGEAELRGRCLGPPSAPTPEQRLSDLERQLAALQQQLQDLRREVQAQATPKVVPMTPEEAVQAFKQDPDRLLTVEFGVESAGWLDGPIPIDEDPTPPIRAEWDGRLSNGGQFALYLTARAIRGLADIGIDLPPATPVGLVDIKRVGLICRHLKGKGVRVTGLIRASRPEDRYTDYTIVVDDPRHFAVNR